MNVHSHPINSLLLLFSQRSLCRVHVAFVALMQRVTRCALSSAVHEAARRKYCMFGLLLWLKNLASLSKDEIGSLDSRLCVMSAWLEQQFVWFGLKGTVECLKRTVRANRLCSFTLLWDVLFLKVQLQPVKQFLVSWANGGRKLMHWAAGALFGRTQLTKFGRGSWNGQKVTIRSPGGEEFPLFDFCTANSASGRDARVLLYADDVVSICPSLSLRAFLCPLSTATATARWVKGAQRCIN